MSLRVTFDIFSGRPNPFIVIEGNDAAALMPKLRSTSKLSGAQAKPPVESVLGYRGLIIEQIGPSSSADLPARVRIAGGKAYAPGLAYVVQESAIEELVFAKAEALKSPDLSPELLGLIRTEAKQPGVAKAAPSTTKTSSPSPGPALPCRCAPLYEPNWWNDAGQKQLHNNCYNYACNYRTDSFAQPGRANGGRITQVTCAGVSPLVLGDSLLSSQPTKNPKCPPEGHLVALVLWPGWDFHFYRLGRDALWSHKPGNWPVTNLDNSGHLITNPINADRGRYTTFCSFMVVMNGHVRIA